MQIFILILLIITPVSIAFSSKFIFNREINNKEFVCQLLISCLIVVAVFYFSIFNVTSDFKVVTGKIISKERKHGSYIRTYQCDCRTVTIGKTTTTQCSTCHETRYTVTWYANSTVGKINLKHLDSGSISVYNSLNPKQYTDCYIGEPASIEENFINYIKASPDSLFNINLGESKYKELEYPRVFNYYHYNRVIGNNNLNKYLNERLSTNKNYPNIIIILNSNERDYSKYIENKWLGGKENNIVISIGNSGDIINWVEVFTYGNSLDNEIITIKLRDSILEYRKIDKGIIDIVMDNIKYYKNINADRFEYLSEDILPSNTILFIIFIISIICSLILTKVFYDNDFFER